MNAMPCEIRRSTIVQVTRPPIGLWRFHWHELFPIARANGGNGNGYLSLYLPEVEPKDGRRALCARLREEFSALHPEFPTVVDGCMVAVLDGDRTGLLPDFQEAELDLVLASVSPEGFSAAVTQRTDTAFDLR